MEPEIRTIVQRATTLHTALAADLEPFGGILRCTDGCGREQSLGNIASHLGGGWPKCCGYTMRWVTQRELDEEAASDQSATDPATS